MTLEYCADRARASNEPLIGTATQNAVQLVLSIPKAEWLPHLEDMPAEVGLLSALVAPLKNQVMLSLRHCPPSERGHLWVFPHGYRFDNLPSTAYPDLLAELLNGHLSLTPQARLNRKTIMICGHSKRDISCAKYSVGLLRALQEHNAGNAFHIWEVSHLGGHRFAGTGVVQPDAHWYGFLTPADVPMFLETLRADSVLLSHYRGNANYPPPLQVAEKWGWEQLQTWGGAGMISLVNPHLEAERAEVEVSLAIGSESYTTRLYLQATPYTFYPDSNSNATKDRLIWQIVGSRPYPFY